MKKNNIYILIVILTFMFGSQEYFLGSDKGNQNSNKRALSKTTADPAQSVLNINNVTTWVGADGFHDWVVASSWNGAFPNGSSVGAIFAEGIVWGGKVNDGTSPAVRVNGNTYGTGCAPITRLYRVRPDYESGDLSKDAASFFSKGLGAVTEADIQQLRDQYKKDWEEWPVDEGALFKDVDGNGQYDPSIDVPGIPGAAQTIFIKYNDSKSSSNYGSPPIGLEVSETYWAYAYSGALGNVIYKKVDIVYTGTPNSAANSTIDSMYIVQWADPDLGASTDDYAGCDTSLNLGYTYNSSPVDATYEGIGSPPPAAGYDFLQGVSQFTGNPADSAIFNLKWRKGYKYVNPKPMSSFAYFAAGGTWSDPSFNYNGTLEFYNLMRGKLPTPRYPSGEPFPESVADVTPFGTYLTAGDPVTGEGKIDGTVDTPGDRRLMVTNGPITMSLGDTAQVVLALVGGFGTDNLNSITKLRENDKTAQIVFDQLFKLPSIDPPVVDVTALHNEIVLSWGTDQESLNSIENFASNDYSFEGYLVYQLPNASSSIEDGVLLGTYDLPNGVVAVYDTVTDINGTSIPELVIQGNDLGLKRFIVIDKDEINKTDLKDGQTYYFAVVSYAVNPAPLLPFHALKSSVVILPVVPQTETPGVRYGAAVGDTLFAVHTGKSDGESFALVVDPSSTTGHTYEIAFVDTPSTTWKIIDKTLDKVVAEGQTNQTGSDDYPIVDGLMFKVLGPALIGTDWSYEGERWLSGDAANGGELMFGAAFVGPNFWGETTVAAPDLKDIRIDVFAVQSYTDTNGNGKYDVGEPYVVDPAKGQMANLYSTWGPGNWEASALVPFKVFDISGDTPRQLSVIVRDRDQNGQWDPDDGTIQYNYVFILDTDYDPTGNDWNPTAGGRDFMDEITINGGPVLWSFWWVPRGSREQMAADFTMTFIAPKVNSSGDTFVIEAPSVTNDPNLAKADVDKVNVFPNPYYGTQNRETSRSNHYVTFNHLPEKATIRIFDLSGVLVKTINHVSTSGQFDIWNLQNDNNYPVSSGIYIVHIEMPTLGKTKILKLAVLQEKQILQVY